MWLCIDGQASLLGEGPFLKPESSQANTKRPFQGFWATQSLPEFAHLLPMPSSGYSRVFQNCFLLPSNLLKWIFTARKMEAHKLLWHLCSTLPIKLKLKTPYFIETRIWP